MRPGRMGWILVTVWLGGMTPVHAQVGACCQGDATCILTDEAGCNTLGGTFLGAGTDCATAECQGACCLPGKTCSFGSADDCTATGGVFQGPGSACETHCPGPLGTAFTYQGQLKQDGVPVQGEVDLRFTLWTAAVGGDPVGTTVTRSAVNVVNGLFTVELDFGPDAFGGNARWLEIEVRAPHDPSDTAPFTTLAPRQALTGTPHALFAQRTRGIHVDDAGNVGVGTAAPQYPLHVQGGDPDAPALFVASSNNWRWDIGDGLGDLSVGDDTYGLSIGVALGGAGAGDVRIWPRGGTERITFGNATDGNIMSIVNGRVGIGDTTPAADLTIGAGDKVQIDGTEGDIRFTDDRASLIFPATDGNNDPMLLMFGSGTNNGSRMVIGHSPTYPDWGLEYVDQGDYFRFSSPPGTTLWIGLGVNRRVGVGLDDPQYPLHVTGDSFYPGLFVESGNHWRWDIDGGLGDLSIGNDTYGLSIGVDTQGAGAGTARIWPWGGSESLILGTPNAGDLLTLDGMDRKVSITSNARFPDATLEVTNTDSFICGLVAPGLSPAIHGVSGNPSGYPSNCFGWPNAAIWGDSEDGTGVLGTTSTGTAIYGIAGDSFGEAGFFSGDVNVVGNLSKSSGSFKIDHPLDPANKYLSHSFVESPDMKNVYDGVVTLDAAGEAVVQLPDYFEALNRDFRYQLTPIGAPMPDLYIAEEIRGNRFRIAGGVPGKKVSWQVTGIRQDPWAQAHRIVVEEDKPAGERGYYLHPELYGQPSEKRIGPKGKRSIE